MLIAVTSQNRRTVTEHAGRCRKFRIFTVEQGRVSGEEWLELAKEQAFHGYPAHQPHPGVFPLPMVPRHPPATACRRAP